MNSAALIIDFINEIVHPEGKLSSKGYSTFVEDNNTLNKLSSFLQKSRDNNFSIIWSNIQFSSDYSDCPSDSPLFKNAKQFEALKTKTWATEIHEDAGFIETDMLLTKNRISAFSSKKLESFLEKKGICNLYIAGVATDLAVSAAAFDAHDKDYNVFIVKDCCAAANIKDHTAALNQLSKFTTVLDESEVNFDD